jgi:hypothetical protein
VGAIKAMTPFDAAVADGCVPCPKKPSAAFFFDGFSGLESGFLGVADGFLRFARRHIVKHAKR